MLTALYSRQPPLVDTPNSLATCRSRTDVSTCPALIRAGHTVRFVHADGFFRAMAQARVDNSVDRTFRSFLAPDLLILDDLGLHRLTAQQSADLYKLILNRHRASSSSSPATGPWMNGSALVHGAPSPDRVAVVTETPVFVTLPQTLGLGRVHAVPKPSHFWAGAKPMIYGYIRTSRAAVDGLAGMHPETQVQAGVEPRHSLGRGSLRLRLASSFRNTAQALP